MKPFSASHKALFGGAAVVAFGVAAVMSVGSAPENKPAAESKAGASDHTMFGGTISRNMVNEIGKGVPEKVDPAGPALLWKAPLGSRSYGGPIVSGGKVFVGTNNEQPRNKRDVDKQGDPIDKGIVMCFDEKTGKLLWQAVHDKLAAGIVNDWKYEGVCSTPTVEGDNVFYVSNRCTVVCADANGFANGNQGIQNEKYKDATDADILWEYDMIKELNVFPHNMSACSPLVVGDIIYVVTANGWTRATSTFLAGSPELYRPRQEEWQAPVENNAPGKNIMHGQWSNPVYAEPTARDRRSSPAATAGSTASLRRRAN